MCLDKLKPIPKRPPTRGWKVFHQHSDGSLGSVYCNRCDVLPTKTWLPNAHPRTVVITQSKTYPSGYHVFRTKHAAELYRSSELGFRPNLVVRPVRIRAVVAYGTQDNWYRFRRTFAVAIANEIYIEEETSGSTPGDTDQDIPRG